MTMTGKEFLDHLSERGLIEQKTANEELEIHLNACRVIYCGFDPTADSLHIGSLIPLLMLKRFQLAGHRPIILIGGCTGLIGDPSFKTEERQLNSPDLVAAWVKKLKKQLRKFLNFDTANENSAIIVDNLAWTSDLSVITFLREVGKHFSVNTMLSRESVKKRLAREGSGISFTEFSYALLQGLDFAELYRRHACTVQIGGSDQWGNIVSGIDLSRRQCNARCFGLTLPLVTKTDGTKFGKTEQGTIWLDPIKTSPYSFYQYWLGVSDSDVYRFLKFFTFLPLEKITQIEASDTLFKGKPLAQSLLASEVTRLVHGEDGLSMAKRITRCLFSGDVSDLSEHDFLQLEEDGVATAVPGDYCDLPLTKLLVKVGVVKSGKEVKDALTRGSLSVNGQVKSPKDNMRGAETFSVERAYFGRYFLLRLGKKKFHLFCN
tara:strand:- start:875 stop:2173 length:1299 start_codon:yes stop_codon:yes gene_type:complete